MLEGKRHNIFIFVWLGSIDANGLSADDSSTEPNSRESGVPERIELFL